jgi:hypothetical protein
MIVHDRFVFLQMRKTGCTFLAEALQRELPPGSLRSVGKHAGWERIPPEARGRPVLAYVRNPWDWYVSWHRFNQARDAPTSFWRTLSAQGRLDFAGTVRNAVSFASEEWGRDLYSAIFRHLVADRLDSDLLTVGRFESLIGDLDRFLSTAGVELPDGALAAMHGGTRLNASERGPYQQYYDEELRDLVGASCDLFVDRFGYRFESG